jgi:methylaspartate mutase sigma subunit
MKPTAIVCTLPSDAHTWNLIVVTERLRELRMNVINLGSCLPIQELVRRAEELVPDLVVVSSINGHGEIEALTLIRALRQAGVLTASRVVIGGKLAVSPERERALVRLLRRAGYAGVYMGTDSWEAFVRQLPDLLLSYGSDELSALFQIGGGADSPDLFQVHADRSPGSLVQPALLGVQR